MNLGLPFPVRATAAPARSVRLRYAVPALLAATVLAPARAGSPSVAYTQRHVYGVTAHVVTVNLNDPYLRITVNLARRGIGHSESFPSFLGRLQPEAAITGTFFDNATLLPVGDIVVRGRRVYTGPAGTGLCIRGDNTARLKTRSWGHSPDWSEFRTVLCTGPTLLRRGRNALFPRSEGYRDPALWALRPRAAAGLTAHNKLLLVAIQKPIHLAAMRNILKRLGAVEAVGLDGGSSTALYANGRILVHPGRSLTNVLTVYRTSTPSPQVVRRLKGLPPLMTARTDLPRRPAVAGHRVRKPVHKARPRNPLVAALSTSMRVAAQTP